MEEHYQTNDEAGRTDYATATHHTDTDQEDYHRGPRGIRGVESFSLLQGESEPSSGSDPKEEV